MFSVLLFTFLIETHNSCFYVPLREPVGLEWNFRIRVIKLNADVKGHNVETRNFLMKTNDPIYYEILLT